MNTIIEKIRAEVERRIKSWSTRGENSPEGQGKDTCVSRVTELTDLLSFLDTLQEQPVCEGLEEYAQKVEDYYDVGEERGYLCTHRGDIKDAVIAGAKWQKERDDKELSEKIASAYQLGLADKEKQMMKDAVEGEVVQDLKGVNRVKSFSKIPEWLYFGDKVRIIIVKEDKQ